MNVDTAQFAAITAERDQLRDSNAVLTGSLRQIARTAVPVSDAAAELVVQAILAARKPAPRHAARGKLRLIKGGRQ